MREKAPDSEAIASEIRASELFDDNWYLARYPDVSEAGFAALEHFISHGSDEGRAASPFFLTAYYREQLTEAERSENAILHYVRSGELRGLRPNPLFDPKHYAAVAAHPPLASRSLLLDYVQQGGGLCPHPKIAPHVYSAAVERRQAGHHPMALLLEECGYYSDFPPVSFSPPHRDRAGLFAHRRSRVRFERLSALSEDSDVLVLSTFSPSGELSEAQRSLVEFYQRHGFEVILVVNASDFDRPVSTRDAVAKTILMRENIGFDVAAWADVAHHLYGSLIKSASVTFTNDSVIPIPDLFPTYWKNSKSAESVVFASRNYQIRQHGQSFFFSAFGGQTTISAVLDTLIAAPVFNRKQDLIERFELSLESFLRLRGVNVEAAYDLGPDHNEGANTQNPTIKHWDDLIDRGFPFIKAALFNVDDHRSKLESLFDAKSVQSIRRHLKSRTRQISNLSAPDPRWRFAFGSATPNNADGAQNAVNVPEALDLPVAPTQPDSSGPAPKVLCVIHCFYMDEAEIILDLLETAGPEFRYLLTCPEPDNVIELEASLSRRGLSGEVVGCENRGRNVAPFLIETPQKVGDADLILHLHTKKSPHDARYENWADHLRRHLVGDRDHVEAIFELFRSEALGLAYSQHFEAVANLRNWGFDFPAARDLLQRLNIPIQADTPLEFPTSTMFWARPSVLRKLWDLNLDYSDFETESGQIDGTLAHSIERILCFLAEDAGHHFCALKNDAQSSTRGRAIRTNRFDDVRRIRPLRLLGNHERLLGLEISELFEVRHIDSPTDRPRINLLIPTLEPKKAYGGITSAMAAFKALVSSMPPPFDVRVICTSDEVGTEALEFASEVFGESVTKVSPADDWEALWTTVQPSDLIATPLSVRRNDVFFATAWWTADLALRLQDMQAERYGGAMPLVYLIQDFEPGFYALTDRYFLAERTYARSEDMISIINSEELYEYFSSRYNLQSAWCLPYKINAQVAAGLKTNLTRDTVLAYARPGTPRNLYRILVAGIRQWQARDPEAGRFKIVFAGEAVPEQDLNALQNAEAPGKMSIDAYADVLSRTAVGVSLMASPHPSYPPLEMAYAGAITITNSFENKDLASRCSNFLTLSEISPETIRTALNTATGRLASRDKPPVTQTLSAPPGSRPIVDWDKIAGHLHDRFRPS